MSKDEALAMSGTTDEDSSDGIRFFLDPHNWPLFYHTAKNMQPRQLSGVVERKARHAVLPRLPIDFDQHYRRQVPSVLKPNPDPIARNSLKLRQSLSESEREQCRTLVEEAADGQFTFLNRTIEFGDDIDWDHELLNEYPLLWRLKLQSFEHIQWIVFGYDPSSSAVAFEPSIENQTLSWAGENPIGEEQYLRRSWIPHSVSLRILNWCRYAGWCSQDDSRSLSDEFYRTIYKNALFLANHIEFEVGGNHLIENAIALIMAGVLFEDHDTGWIETGLKVLKQASKTQFLADGGHFERSPMYHVMVLRRYSTAYDLLSDNDFPTATLKDTAELALGFLLEIAEPDGEIPLLNDSVHGEQIKASSCIAYSHACDLSPRDVTADHPQGSGYRKLTTNGATLLIDVGEVGPPHLPAHSHNDQLSVLLWVDGKPLLTDTGVYDYAPTSRRRFSRSVSAHNTAQYSDVEPIPTGGRYLMGKRTSPELVKQSDGTIHGRYSRQGVVGPNYTHQREVSTISSGVAISDEVNSHSDSTFTVRYHFDPSITVMDCTDAENTFVACDENEELAMFRFSGADHVQSSQSLYFEQYGHEVRRPMIAATADVNHEISARISVGRGQPDNSGNLETRKKSI